MSELREKILEKWHDILNPENTFNTYRSLLSEITGLSARERLQKWIHGKKFWELYLTAYTSRPSFSTLTGKRDEGRGTKKFPGFEMMFYSVGKPPGRANRVPAPRG